MSNCNLVAHKNKKDSIIIKILLVVTIAYNSGSALMTINNILGILLICLSIVLLLIKYKTISSKININNTNLLFLMLTILPIVSTIANFNISHIDSMFKYLLIIIFSYLFTRNIDADTYIYYFVKVMKIIVVLSLIPFFMYTIFNISLYEDLPVFTNVNGVSYSIGIIFNSFKNAYDFRNIGIFWEPSIYSTYIIIALIYEISFNETKLKLRNIIIFTIGLFTTQSSGGIVLIFLIPLLCLHKKNHVFYNMISSIGILLGAFLAIINYDKIINYLSLVFPRIFFQLENGMENVSIYSRVGSIGANIELFFQRPIFGWGLGKFDLEFASYDISQTSTSTYFLGVFGVLGIIYTLILIFGVFRINRITILERTTIVILFLMAFNKESHFWLLNTYVLLFYLVKGLYLRDKNEVG